MVKLFVEGGGDTEKLRPKCKKGFKLFLEQTELRGKMPKIVAAGSRQNALDDYRIAKEKGEEAFLLVDSEEPVSDFVCAAEDFHQWKPLQHLAKRDNWEIPPHAQEEECHLMVQFMESWFVADPECLKIFYGQNFRENALPDHSNIEEIKKAAVIGSLEKATEKTKKGKYHKGDHSFEILEKIDPQKVMKRSRWAERFITLLAERQNRK